MNEKLITLNDCSLYCIEDVEGAKKDIVLLHGARFSAATWQKTGTLDILSKVGYRIHALDMPGFGKSEACSASPVQLLYDFIQKEAIDSPVLIGPSMGGGICLDYYFTRPETIGGLVLVGTVRIQNYRNRFRDVNVPCLLVWGENDTVSPLSGAHFLQNEIPGAELVILERASHPCYLDQPDKWHRSLVSFLSLNNF